MNSKHLDPVLVWRKDLLICFCAALFWMMLPDRSKSHISSVITAAEAAEPVTIPGGVKLWLHMGAGTMACELTLYAQNDTPSMIETLAGRYDFTPSGKMRAAGGDVMRYNFELIEPGRYRSQKLQVSSCDRSAYVRVLSVDFCRIGGRSYNDCGKVLHPAPNDQPSVVLARNLIEDD